jgi:hypothetical protein
LTGLLAAAAALFVAAPAYALGISVPSTGTLSALTPGQTATASNIDILVTGVVLPWSLSVAPEASATPGKLRASGGGCSNSPAALASPLHVAASALAGSPLIDGSSFDLGSGTTQIAHGSTPATVRLGYSQPVALSEPLVAGCAYSITLVFTAS